MRFVHHPIECKPRGALEGEHFWGNVIRKRACHRREQRAWLKGNGWVTLLCFSPAPSPVCSPSGALLHFPADVIGTRQRPGMPQLQGSSLSPIMFPSLLSSPLTQLLQLSCPFLTLTKTWAAFGYWEAYTPPRSLLVSSQIVRSKEIHLNPSRCWNRLSTVSTGSDNLVISTLNSFMAGLYPFVVDLKMSLLYFQELLTQAWVSETSLVIHNSKSQASIIWNMFHSVILLVLSQFLIHVVTCWI